MSLINQMLRDLEQRQQTPDNRPAPVTVTPYAERHPGQKYRWLTAILLLTAGVYLYATRHSVPQPTTPSQPTTTAALAANAANSQSNQAIVANRTINPAAPTPPPLSTIQAQPPQPARIETPVTPQVAATTTRPTPTASLPGAGNTSGKPARPARPKGDQLAEHLFRQAQQDNQELDKLRQALAINPRHLPARQLLLQRLSKAGDNSQLRLFLEDSLAQYPDNPGFIKARAHLYLQQKDSSAALQLLQRRAGGTDIGYWGLLAAAYQTAQNYPMAADSYQHLLQLQADKAENWLGLAIAQDHLNQAEAAVVAYRRALDKNTLKAEVVDYIYQRLNALER